MHKSVFENSSKTKINCIEFYKFFINSHNLIHLCHTRVIIILKAPSIHMLRF
jgi:hypothetical protein